MGYKFNWRERRALDRAVKEAKKIGGMLHIWNSHFFPPLPRSYWLFSALKHFWKKEWQKANHSFWNFIYKPE
jgi:hypothetical protein